EPRAGAKAERAGAGPPGVERAGPAGVERAAAEGAGGLAATADPTAYNVQLPAFEGSLDLLLHLVQTHQLDIFDIPIRFITEKYLEYLTVMRHLAIDVASEYLVMAAVLAHIKSKMLLPEPPADQADELGGEELDPREELVRRLLEYQKYKDAAARLASLGTAGQDAMPRPASEAAPEGPAPLAPVPVFQLLDAFAKLLSKRKVRVSHEISFDRLSITDRIHELTAVFRARGRRLHFESLFGPEASRFDLVITFLALLEMSRLRMARLFQSAALGQLDVEYTAEIEGEEGEGEEAAAEASEEPAGEEAEADAGEALAAGEAAEEEADALEREGEGEGDEAAEDEADASEGEGEGDEAGEGESGPPSVG
ncbi:MAG TPA: segregation/condensation protein A, partial [Polyangiaceae bacterium]|nr:segregation/condensation protein A [Polyangiaceae bacterium]